MKIICEYTTLLFGVTAPRLISENGYFLVEFLSSNGLVRHIRKWISTEQAIK